MRLGLGRPESLGLGMTNFGPSGEPRRYIAPGKHAGDTEATRLLSARGDCHKMPREMKPPGCGSDALLDVLLVDDDRNDLALFGMAADKADVNIWLQTATGAEQAIEYLEGKGVYGDRTMHPMPDLLLLDLLMPGMDGFAFLAWRKGCAAFSKLPVVILSGLGDQVRIERALALGADGFLPKPADFDGWTALARQVWDLGIKRRLQFLTD